MFFHLSAEKKSIASGDLYSTPKTLKPSDLGTFFSSWPAGGGLIFLRTESERLSIATLDTPVLNDYS